MKSGRNFYHTVTSANDYGAIDPIYYHVGPNPRQVTQGLQFMKITFLGAAGEVTGSQHLIETDNLRLLLDCGLFQGRRSETHSKNAHFRCDPKTLDGVILSHAHIDHCGNLPGLYKAGFRGPIFCTEATADVADIMLRDSAGIQAEDAKYLSRRLKSGHPPLEPLYSRKDVRETVRLFETLEYGEWHELSPQLSVRLSEAGHILGSAVVEIDLEDAGERKNVIFTGDLGRRGLPLLRDPQPVGGCDVLICESTYGNRVHPPAADMKSTLLRIITEAVNRGGRVIIPAFSLGRTQNVVYFLNQLTEEQLLPEIPIFVDSPLSTRLTEVYRRHQDLLDADAQRLLSLDDDLFRFPKLNYIRTQQESIALNRFKEPCVIISASGMCENGRIRHHLKHAISGENNTVLIIGFQAAHTLGRRLVEKRERVRMFDREFPVRAHIEIVNGLSAHADVEDFKWFFQHMAADRGIGQAFLVHGDPAASQSLAGVMDDFCDEPPIIPENGETFEV
jgi:metallo-beta-lactamase family protein